MPADPGSADGEVFRLGVNYWPAENAMDWLAAYDPQVTRRDFARARAAGLDCLRIFLRWADVQPAEATIDAATLGHLVDAADAASESGATLIVTLFVGHMSGVNWAPEWATGGTDGDRRFRVVTPGAGPSGRTGRTGLRNWYTDPAVGPAQERVATAAAYTGRALDGLRAAGCSGALLWCFADRPPPPSAAAVRRSPPRAELRPVAIGRLGQTGRRRTHPPGRARPGDSTRGPALVGHRRRRVPRRSPPPPAPSLQAVYHIYRRANHAA